MNDANTLVARLCERETAESPRLADVIAGLDEQSGLGSLGAYLATKESQDRARMAYADRERWAKKLSWRFVRLVFLFGLLAAGTFTLWGGERGFEAAIFFVAGGATFYFLAQLAVSWRQRGDRRALQDVEARCTRELAELAARLGSGGGKSRRQA